jgi:hypothetical protein
MGGDTKEAFVLSIEVGSVLIPDAIGCTGRIQVFREHQTTGLLKSQPLLELQGAHRGDGLEVMVEARNAHPQLVREVLDVQWLVEVLAQSGNGSGDIGGVSPQDRQVAEAVPLLSYEETIDDFPRNQWQQDRHFGRSIQESDKTHGRVEQIAIQQTDIDSSCVRLLPWLRVSRFQQN